MRKPNPKTFNALCNKSYSQLCVQLELDAPHQVISEPVFPGSLMSAGPQSKPREGGSGRLRSANRWIPALPARQQRDLSWGRGGGSSSKRRWRDLGLWEWRQKIGKERTKLRNVLVFVFLQGTVEELPLPVPAGSNHCGKSLPCRLQCLCGPGIHEAGFFFQHGFATHRIHRRTQICSVGSPEQLCGTTLHHQWGGFQSQGAGWVDLMTGVTSVVEGVCWPCLIAKELVRVERFCVPVATADIQEQHLVPQVLPVTWSWCTSGVWFPALSWLGSGGRCALTSPVGQLW